MPKPMDGIVLVFVSGTLMLKPMDGLVLVFVSGHKCSIHLLAFPPSLEVRT